MRISPILLLLVAVLGCGSGSDSAKKSAESLAGNSPTAGSQSEESTDEFILKIEKFDFRPKPKKFAPNSPEAEAAIEKEIRRVLGKQSGELTRADFEKVTSVNLMSKNITDLAPVAKLTNLKDLSLKKSGVTRLEPLTKLTMLEHLFLPSQSIIDLTPLAGLTNLENLILGENYIADVTPLAGLTKLEQLFLRDNYITDVTPLAELTNLKELVLTGNKITDLKPLVGLTNLKMLNIHLNPDITRAEVEMLQKALPNCKISHTAKK